MRVAVAAALTSNSICSATSTGYTPLLPLLHPLSPLHISPLSLLLAPLGEFLGAFRCFMTNAFCLPLLMTSRAAKWRPLPLPAPPRQHSLCCLSDRFWLSSMCAAWHINKIRQLSVRLSAMCPAACTLCPACLVCPPAPLIPPSLPTARCCLCGMLLTALLKCLCRPHHSRLPIDVSLGIFH